jgi:hypothetical protein
MLYFMTIKYDKSSLSGIDFLYISICILTILMLVGQYVEAKE